MPWLAISALTLSGAAAAYLGARWRKARASSATPPGFGEWLRDGLGAWIDRHNETPRPAKTTSLDEMMDDAVEDTLPSSPPSDHSS